MGPNGLLVKRMKNLKISSILIASLMILVTFTGCMSDEESSSDEEVEIIVEDDTENSQDGNTTTSNNTDDTNNDGTSEVYDGPLKILALHGGGDTPEGLESQSGMQALMADLPEFEFFRWNRNSCRLFLD